MPNAQEKFQALFSCEKVLLPVIHAIHIDQVLKNARIAFEEGADGIFLINHDMKRVPAKQLVAYAECVQLKIPGLPVGLNFLDKNPIDSLYAIPDEIPMLWCDDGGIHDNRPFPCAAAQQFVNERAIRKWDGLYFGGVAFKGQEPASRPQDHALTAVGLMDVITTSGDATGIPPDIGKVAFMSHNCCSTPFALASGISAENVGQYLKHASAFLVSTSISDGQDMFVRSKVRELCEAIH